MCQPFLYEKRLFHLGVFLKNLKIVPVFKTFLTWALDGGKWLTSRNFTPRLLYPRGKSRWYSLCTRLRRPQHRSRHSGEEKLSCLCRESNPSRPACRCADWPIPSPATIGNTVFILNSLTSSANVGLN
jgi:hypothetical protein